MIIDIEKQSADKVRKFFAAFGKQAESAHVRATNRALMGIRTDGVRLVREEYNVKAGVVRKAFSVHRASPNNLEAKAVAFGRRIPLKQFSPRPSKPGGRLPPKGVSVEVRKGARKIVRSSFFARMKSGHTGVFTRVGKERLPIRERHSLAVPQMLNREDVTKELEAGAVKRFERTLDHEINRALQKMGAK
ncbi:MAG: phage tail protein [Desulfobacterales bacterium]|nr:phage tail protein [Desulfobacterales bacterium]